MSNEMKLAEQIRASYTEKEITKIEELKALDRKVKAPAEIFAYVFGSVSALILGAGMCLVMKVIGAALSFAMPLGIGIGILGILLMAVNYPIYKKILKGRKTKYSKQIMELADSLLNK